MTDNVQNFTSYINIIFLTNILIALPCWARSGNIMRLRYEQYSSCVLIKDKTMYNVLNCNSYINKIYEEVNRSAVILLEVK
jgi:hypothetical protein